MEGAAAAWLKAADVPVRRSKPLLSFRDEIAAARRDAAFDDAADTITPRGRSLRKPLVSLPSYREGPTYRAAKKRQALHAVEDALAAALEVAREATSTSPPPIVPGTVSRQLQVRHNVPPSPNEVAPPFPIQAPGSPLASPLASPKPHSGFKKGGPRARRQSAGGESVSRAVSAASFSPLASPTPSSVGKPSARRQKEEALRQSEAALRQRNAELEEALATARATLETMALAALEENKSQLTHRLAEEDEAQAEAEVASASSARIAEKEEDRQTLQLQLHLIEDQINQLRCVPTPADTAGIAAAADSFAAVGALLESDPLLQTPGGGASYVPFTTAPGSPST